MKRIILAGGTVLGENVFIDDISPYVANFQQISTLDDQTYKCQ